MILVGIYNLVWLAVICLTIIAVIYLFRAGTTTVCDCGVKKDKDKEREKRRRRRKCQCDGGKEDEKEGDGEEEQKEGDKEPDPDENKEPDVNPEPEPEPDEEEEEDEEELIEWFYVEQDENANGVPQTSVTIEWEGVLRPLDGYRFRYRCYTYDNNTDKETVSAFTNADISEKEMLSGTKKITGLSKSSDRYDRDYEFVLTDRKNVPVEDIDEEWVWMDY